MWNDRRSIVLSKICVVLFLVILCAVAVSGPWLFESLLQRVRPALQDIRNYFFITVYSGAIPAAFLLIRLSALLRRIEKDEVFVEKNVAALRHISWCCFTGAVISLVSAFYYFPWLIVGAAAAFMGLIVRVVKNVVAKAVELQNEADFTI